MATRDEINDEFYAGYGDQPRAMTLMDYLTPSSYIDPYKSLRNPPLEMDEKGFRQLSQTEANKVYNDPRYNPNLSANAQYDKLYGQTNANKFSMPDLTNYIPSPSSITKYIPTELPNVFGVNNPMYAGLLGAEQAQALSKQSNVAGLLGGLASLATGLGRQGPRRSAFQNIISALGAGYGSAGQAYQQGLQTYSQAQQLALLQRQQAGIQAMKNKYPDLADEFDTNPAGAFRIVAEREAAAKKPTVVSQGATLVSPTGEVLFTDPMGRDRKTAVVNGQLVDTATGKVIFGEPTGDKTSDIKNYEYYKANVPPGQKVKTFEQWSESVNKGTTVNVMPPGAVPLGKEGSNKVDSALLDLGQSRLNLQSIASSFNPKYLETPFKLKMAAVAEGEKVGIRPDQKTAQELAEYSKFTQDAYTQLNNYINQITGAAVGSGDEERRIRKGIPDPQKDSPTEFVSKLKAKIQEGRLYEARLGYIKQNGMKITDVDVNKIPTLMREREAKIKSNKSLFGNKDYNPKDVNHQSIVRAILSKEFGLME